MPAGNGVSLAEILNAISPELLSMGTKIAKLEEVIGQTVQSSDPISHGLIFELQDLDRVRQCILDLARLTRHVSEEAANGLLCANKVEAIATTLHLSSTKQLLSGTIAEQERDDAEDGTSDLHLF